MSETTNTNTGKRRPSSGGGHFSGRRKTDPFGPNGLKIDYKDVRTLGHFISEGGKIIPSRISAAKGINQRLLKQAIKRARFLGLLPYINDRASV